MRGLLVQPFTLRINADHMVGTGKETARMPVGACGLIKVVDPDDIGPQDARPGLLARNPSKVQNAIAPRHSRINRHRIGQIASHHLGARLRVFNGRDIRKPQRFGDMAKPAAQVPADAARRAGYQKFLEHFRLSR